jgi:hypothetical protein
MDVSKSQNAWTIDMLIRVTSSIWSVIQISMVHHCNDNLEILFCQKRETVLYMTVGAIRDIDRLKEIGSFLLRFS